MSQNIIVDIGEWMFTEGKTKQSNIFHKLEVSNGFIDLILASFHLFCLFNLFYSILILY